MKKNLGWIGFSLLVAAVFPVALLAQDAASQQQAGAVTDGDLNVEHGQINWTDKTITATGSGAPDLKAPNVAVARLGAERVAKLDALRNILEALKGVRINSEVTVESQIITQEKMKTKIEGVARHFKVLRTKYYSDGGVDLVVQMSLDGEIANTLLPDGTKTGEVPAAGEAKQTGLVIDCRGIKVMPALGPRILNETGGVIYSSEFLEEKALQDNGVVAYFKDMDAATKSKRVGATPMVIKALKVSDSSKTDIVLSNADAEKLRDPGANLKFLTQAKVAIVID